MFHIIWVFVAAPERAREFAAAYGPDGGWVGLFREGAGYHDTELFQSQAEPSRFLTVDRWDSRSAYEQFRRERGPDYARLDAACKALTVQEEFLGAFGE
ncbi:MAG: antibiotic biosynthesis monooxygenase family protein [Gemmatimonadales bacterium]